MCYYYFYRILKIAWTIFYILTPPAPRGGGGEIWPKGLRGKEKENLRKQFVQKLEQNDKNVFIFTLLQIYVRGKLYLRKGEWKKYNI